MMGGQCDGSAFVERTFELRKGCRGCFFLEEPDCQVVEGREPATKCPQLEEHIRYHGIKLYGRNA